MDQHLTPKKSYAESPRHKNFQKALNDITRKNRNIGFEYPPKSLHNSSYQQKKKKICQNSPLPPKIPKSKISNPKKSFDHPCHLKSGVPPPPHPAGTQTSLQSVRNISIE